MFDNDYFRVALRMCIVVVFNTILTILCIATTAIKPGPKIAMCVVLNIAMFYCLNHLPFNL